MKFLALLLFLCTTSCSFFEDPPPLRADEDLLSASYAKLRKQGLDEVRYQLYFDLTHEKHFKGEAQIFFELKNNFYLTLDFTGGRVLSLKINGQAVALDAVKANYIELPEKHLRLGGNQVQIEYEHPYSMKARGLYRFKDPLDQKVYIYSDFEPYHAHHVFPSFDQPNLKSHFVTEVLVPAQWQVITANREAIREERDKYSLWRFPRTAPMSPYAYSIHAGDYVSWEGTAHLNKQELPLRVFSRASMKDHIDGETLLDITAKGIVYFSNYFNYPFPYEKYDQLIVPDLDSGAMENVAAVTFNEQRFFQSKSKTRNTQRWLTVTLLHELAHMWFGNLVTMNWWNDLWLNESFATHSAYQALSAITDYKEGWMVFNAYTKQDAYDIDLSANPRAVATAVENTDEAVTRFDGISYGKGAAILRQLSYSIGEKSYRRALSDYFRDFENSNTSLQDFIAKMEMASDMELGTWSQRWLETERPNNLEVNFTCEKGRITHFELYQTATQEYPTLRVHRTQLALFKKQYGYLRLSQNKVVEYQGETTQVPSLKGAPCPDAVYPNSQDYDYVNVKLDRHSLPIFLNHLSTLGDPFLRSLLWSDLWRMTLARHLDMEQFLEVVEWHGIHESDPDILHRLLSRVQELLFQYYPNDGDIWNARSQAWRGFFSENYFSQLQKSADNPDLQKVYFQHWLELSDIPEHQNQWVLILKNRPLSWPLNFSVEPELRWKVLAALTALGHTEAQSLLEMEKKRDTTAFGRSQALWIESLKPDLKNKEKRLVSLFDQSQSLPWTEQKAIVQGLFPPQQKLLQKKLSQKYYNILKDSLGESNSEWANAVQSLTPLFCDAQSGRRIESLLKSEANLSASLIKVFQGLMDKNQTCYEMQKLLKDNGSTTPSVETLSN